MTDTTPTSAAPERPSSSSAADVDSSGHPGAKPTTTTTAPTNTRPSFAPVFTLVDNTSTRTTHHPHVRYIFSDDDPDILTHALAEYDSSGNSHANPNANNDSSPASGASAGNNRAMILDLAQDGDGGYSVAWSSSLSPSWALLNAQLSEISPPSSEAGHSSASGNGNEDNKEGEKTDTKSKETNRRLMLRIEGIDMTAPDSASSELRVSDRRLQQGGSGSASGSGSGSSAHREQQDGDDYASMLDEFGKRMSTLRKVVNASEDRRKKIASGTGVEAESVHSPEVSTHHDQGADTEDDPSPGHKS